MVRLNTAASPEPPIAKLDREPAGGEVILMEEMSDPALAPSER